MAVSVYTWIYLADVGSTTMLDAGPPLGTLQLFSPTNIRRRIYYNLNSKMYLQQRKYLPPPTQYIYCNRPNSHFYNSLPNPLLWWHPVVKLFRSKPQIPIRFVFFVAFLGQRLLAVFWCFCEALAVGWEEEGRSLGNTRAFSRQTPTGHWGAFYEPGRPDLARGWQTKIWANTKPRLLSTIILGKFARAL